MDVIRSGDVDGTLGLMLAAFWTAATVAAALFAARLPSGLIDSPPCLAKEAALEEAETAAAFFLNSPFLNA